MCAHDRLAETIVVDEGKEATRREAEGEQPDESVSLNAVESS